MAAEIRHTLINLEITPPPGAWDTIASRLDAEFDPEETAVAQKLDDYTVVPPITAWEKIGAALEEAPVEEFPVAVASPPAKLVSIPFRKWAMAAAVISILALGAWYFLSNNPNPKNNFTQVDEPATNKKLAQPENNAAAVPNVAVTDSDDRPRPRRSFPPLTPLKKLAEQYALNVVSSDLNPDMASDDIPHADPPRMQAMHAVAQPNVAAPPIRDASGEIILDKQLIYASPDHNYIVVTGPNGEQTRISSKFLPLLNSLNGNTESNNYFHFFLNENNIWKLRFNEWRDKMLRQASFIPTATFLDMLELKDILQENQ